MKNLLFLIFFLTIHLYVFCQTSELKKGLFKDHQNIVKQCEEETNEIYKNKINELLKSYKVYKRFFCTQYEENYKILNLKNTDEDKKVFAEYKEQKEKIKSEINEIKLNMREHYFKTLKEAKDKTKQRELFNKYNETRKELNEKINELFDDLNELQSEYKKKRLEFTKKKSLLFFNNLKEKNRIKEELQKEFKSEKIQLKDEMKQKKNEIIVEKINVEIQKKISAIQLLYNHLSENSITFVTNGSRINKKHPQDMYFFDENKKPNSSGYTEDVTAILNSVRGYFLEWNGINNDLERLRTAFNFFHEIKERLEIRSIDSNIPEKEIPINLIGHSHGGNIMIIVANLLKADGYNVQFLLTLSTPSREYQLEYDIPHIQIYSYSDVFFKIGGWDFDYLFLDLKYDGNPQHKFNNAVNINLIYFLDEETFNFYNVDYMKYYPNSSYHHQITRYSGVVKKIFDKNTSFVFSEL